MRKEDMIEIVLGILSEEEVSDERIEAFREAKELYDEWKKEVSKYGEEEQ